MLLPYVLETIVEHAMHIVGADSASLHWWLYDSDNNRYIYEVCAGDIDLRFLKENPPRADGLGIQAIQEKRPKFIPDPSQGHHELELEDFDPAFFAQGVRAKAAFPLFVDQKQGVLYLHFQRPHRFTEDEIGWVQLFIQRAVDAIRHATMYTQMRDRTRQLNALNAVAQSLVSRPEESELLKYIAWNARNVLVADIVTLYEYI